MVPLRQNIGYYASMFYPTKGTTMIMNKEQALLKAQAQLDQLIESVHSAVEQSSRIDQVERDLMAQLLDLGLTLLNLFVTQHGNGDLGATAETCRGPNRPTTCLMMHDRRYVAIFGELAIPRIVYGTREGQKIELAPLDKTLGLPEGDFSYVVQDWVQRFCLKGSFAEAAESLQTLLRLRLGVHTLERMSQEMADSVVPFREAIEPPPAAEEGPILVVTADGKGVPMRRPAQDGPKPHHRHKLDDVMAEVAGWGLDRTQVHVIDGEVDSVGHYHRWHAAGHRFVYRYDHDSVVLHQGRECELAEVVAGLGSRFVELRHTEGRLESVTIRVGVGTVHVAETEVILHGEARHYTGERTASGHKKQVEVPARSCRCGWWSHGWSTKPVWCWQSGGC